MSLVGFRGNNHPQQVGRRGALDQVDDRGTPDELYGPLNTVHGFTLDVAAAPHNARCDRFYTLADDGLAQPWDGRVWCNPPYSALADWVAKAWAEWLAHRPPVIVMLLPANRCEQRWWQQGVEPYRDRGVLTSTFLPGRPRFIMPGEDAVRPNQRPPFGLVVLTWQRRVSAGGTRRGA